MADNFLSQEEVDALLKGVNGDQDDAQAPEDVTGFDAGTRVQIPFQRDQGVGRAHVGEAVVDMEQSTQQNAALVEQMAAAASSISVQADDLVHVVSAFTISGDARR